MYSRLSDDDALIKTYNISVSSILARRRGQYDLEDEFLWFHEYLMEDPRWKWRRCDKSRVLISDNPSCSIITLDCPNIELINEKQNFVEICGREAWVPESVVLNLENGKLSVRSRKLIISLNPTGQWFLKKAGPGIGGGFDVTPMFIKGGDNPLQRIENEIIKQNINRRYRRDVFVLQAGIYWPLLTSLGQKMDLRLYMLIVGNSRGRLAFYACKVGNIRNTVHYPYDPRSEDTRLQITNTAQNRKFAKKTEEFTRIFSLTTQPDWYTPVFQKFLHIVKRLGIIYSPLLRSKWAVQQIPFVTLIGLDAVIDSRTLDPMIVELNKRPTVYTPQEAEEMNHSATLFMRDVFDLGVVAISENSVGQIPSLESQFVLIHREG